MITPNDIETKVFSYSVRGYNRNEVDEFLDQIMIDYQALLDQNAKMKERIGRLQKQVAGGVDPTVATASTVDEAKKLMNDITVSAEKKAKIIIRNAEVDAQSILDNAKSSTSQADEEALKLRDKIENFKARYRAMLTDEIERIDDKSEDLLADLKTDFYPESIFDDGKSTSPITRATGIGMPEDTSFKDDVDGDLPDAGSEEEKPDKAGAVPGVVAAGASGIPEAAEADDDPLLERARAENVDVNDLPGFRSSKANDMDQTMVFNVSDENTMELDGKDVSEEGSASGEEGPEDASSGEPADKVDELKDAAKKLAQDLFSKKPKND